MDCIPAIDASNDGQYIALGTIDDKVILKNSEFETLKTEPVNLGLIDLKFAGNSSKFAFTSFDYKIRIFDVEVREVVSTLEGNATETFKVCLDFEGNTVYTGGHSGEVAAMGTARGDKIRTMRTHNEHFVTSFASNANGDLTFGNSNGSVYLMTAHDKNVTQ